MINARLKTDARTVFGRQVRRCRLNAGLTQDAVSEMCGIYRTYLSRIENGTANPTIFLMAALADTLHIDLCELFLSPPSDTL